MTDAPATGLWMLLVLGGLILLTGLPVWALLIGVAGLFSIVGIVTGIMEVGVLAALPTRMIGLLEHDLLQALPLYVFIGVLLQRLTVADHLFTSLGRLFRRTGAGQSIAALCVGAVIAPMNGSVASSSALLARLVAPRLRRMQAAGAMALVSVAATIGVVVPPSLVLILLGDSMLRAHTEASNLPGYLLGDKRVINTQDLFNSALLPALAILLLWVVVAWWQGRKMGPTELAEPLRWTQELVSVVTLATILLLLGAVFTGKLYAVEAAASGGVLLIMGSIFSRALDWPQWREVLRDTMSLSGALFALLVGATTFSLVFRLLKADLWIANVVAESIFSPAWTALFILLAVALCAMVLDAFEMIFVIIPIVAPLLIVKLGDAQQSAVLLLLVLQLSFLMPPLGYAVLMARSNSSLGQVSNLALLKSLSPFVLVQVAMTILVFLAPWTVHQLDRKSAAGEQVAPMSAKDIDEKMRMMAPPVEPAESKPEKP